MGTEVVIDTVKKRRLRLYIGGLFQVYNLYGKVKGMNQNTKKKLANAINIQKNVAG